MKASQFGNEMQERSGRGKRVVGKWRKKPGVSFTVIGYYGTKIVTYGTYVLLFASSIWFLTGRNRQSILFVVYELKAPTQEARDEL